MMGNDRKLKICIDRDECIGDKACENDAPETFGMDDDDKAVVLNPQGDDLESILAAAENCPVDCITVIDEETGEKLYPKE
jgi:ferredoxin